MISVMRAVGFCGVLAAAVAVAVEQRDSLSKPSKTLAAVLLQATSDDRFNYVSSPFAGSAIFTLIAEGADAETKSQLVQAMGGVLPDKSSYKELFTSIKSYLSDRNQQNKVVLKNFLYVYKNYSVIDSFAELARDYYLADVRTVARPDLEVVRAVTADGAGAEDDAVEGFKEHAMLAFNGFTLEMSWPTSTWHKTSVSWNGNVVRAFGAAGNFAIGRIPSIDSTVFQLPYKNTDYALLVVLPNKKDTTLKEVMEKLAQTTFDKLLEATSMVPAFVTMPCFQSNNITYMKTVMQQNTVLKNVFTDSADLTKLSSDKLYLDDMVQQTGIRMCTDGASSYSLTSSAFTLQRVVKDSVVADRPFLYALYNVANNVIYVAGKLERPVWEETADNEEEDNGDSATDAETIKT